jgi:putative flippase GtrA
MLKSSEWRVEAGRVLRYGLIGLLSAVIYFGATFVGVERLGWSPVLASIFAQSLTLLPTFYGHALYSFRLTADREYFVRFVVVVTILFLINFGITWLMTEHESTTYRTAMIVVAVAIPLANFLLNRFWVFLPGLLRGRPAQRTFK